MHHQKSLPNFKKIKESIGFEEVLIHYGLLDKLRRKGDQLTGHCPIHQGEGDKCFSVNLKKNCFNCFSCRAHGNILDFVVSMEKVELKEAGLLLSDWFNLPLQDRKDDKPKNSPSSKTQRKTGLVRERKEDRKSHYATSADIVNALLTFELKNLDPEHPYLKNRGLLPKTIQFFGLGYCPRGLMGGRVVIPIHNEKGELVAYAGRAINEKGEKGGKYKLPKRFQKSALVFNLHRAKEHAQEQALILVEGYFSVFKLWQAGFPNAAALMGSCMSEEQERLILETVGATGKVVLLLDHDKAGLRCQQEVLGRLMRKSFVKVVALPEGVRQVDAMEDSGIKSLLDF